MWSLFFSNMLTMFALFNFINDEIKNIYDFYTLLY